MSKIMIIDDDVYIGDMLKEALSNEGYETVQAYSGTEALLLLERQTPDVILLDLMLPGLSGEALLPKIGAVPVIVVSAKIGVDDKVDMLLGGAADYITKPFEIRELLARIKVQLRKSRNGVTGDVLAAGDVRLDMGNHEVNVAGNVVKLTKTEHAILKLLMQNEGNAISKSMILDRISEDTPDCTDSSLKQHISNLRKKLREVSPKEYIEAVWGIGFRFKG
ncbi:MAG: response regulator transcription factor [Clostridium sp.]|nr:response regulator transcription factor [Clostridium sp.]MCM1398355.1 response regulator transcription factor [Clostridium sp.]MCM1458980.1 response regulator transcription factor [Bacteroides sp.]